MHARTNNWLLDPPLDLAAVALPSAWVAGENETAAKLEPYCLYGCSDYPDSGLRATAAGLARHQAFFMQYGELDGVRLLKESTVREMRRKQTLNSGKEIEGGQVREMPPASSFSIYFGSNRLNCQGRIQQQKLENKRHCLLLGPDLVLWRLGSAAWRRWARAAWPPRQRSRRVHGVLL